MRVLSRKTSAAFVVFVCVGSACRAQPEREARIGTPNPTEASVAGARSEPEHDAGRKADLAVLERSDASTSRYLRTTILGREAVIVPEGLAADYLEPILFDRSGNPPLKRSAVARGRAITGYFTPDETCLQRLETGLEAFLLKARGGSRLAEKQRVYKRQYAGFRTDGPRVHATLLCREIHAWEWTSYPYSAHTIEGGGDCFVDVVFGCEDAVYSDLTLSD